MYTLTQHGFGVALLDIFLSPHVSMQKNMYKYINTSMYIFSYTYIHICIHIYVMYIYICIHKYTLTQHGFGVALLDIFLSPHVSMQTRQLACLQARRFVTGVHVLQCVSQRVAVYVCMYRYMYVYIYIYVYIFICIYICICIYMCIYIFICIYTYI